jgi:hypothetical protein
MALEQKAPSHDPAQEPVTAGQLGSLVESIKAMTPPKKIRFNEFRTRSPFRTPIEGADPTVGRRKAKKLLRTCYQNGHRCNPALLGDEEIQLLNGLQGGVFIDKLVRVRLETGSAGSPDKLWIEYANKTHDQRIQVGDHWRSFVALLRLCTDEAKSKKKSVAQDED